MGQYEEIIKVMKIENDEDQKEMIDKWIKKAGIDKVYKECMKIFKDEKKK